MTTIATGGFSSHDASFGDYQGPMEYAAALFMMLASLPFVRFVQLIAGSARPLLLDTQIRAYIGLILTISLIVALSRILTVDAPWEPAVREALFNVTSIISGTGFSSTDYQLWGGAAVAVFFFVGLIGGCAGSTSCSIKVFRYQLLFASISTQVRRLYAPNGIFEPRYQGRPVAEDVLSAVMAFFVLFFFVSLGVISVLLGLTGLDFHDLCVRCRHCSGECGTRPGPGDRTRGRRGHGVRLAQPCREVDPDCGDADWSAGTGCGVRSVFSPVLARLGAAPSPVSPGNSGCP